MAAGFPIRVLLSKRRPDCGGVFDERRELVLTDKTKREADTHPIMVQEGNLTRTAESEGEKKIKSPQGGKRF